MKDLKTIIESGNSKNLSISLTVSDISNMLFALVYVYWYDEEADKWQRDDYKSIYTNLYKEAVKIFGKDELDDRGIHEDIKTVRTKC